MPDIQTTLAKDIDIENLTIRYDRSVKCVLANIPVLAPIAKYTVKELENCSIPMIEKCIDAESIQISEVFVEPGLSNVNTKILNNDLEDKVPGEGRILYDIRFTITLPDGNRSKIIFIHLNGQPDSSQHQLISLLDTLLSRMDAETKKKKLQEEHQLPMTIKLEKEMNDMCNLSSGIREDGFKDGLIKGERKGTLRTNINNIRNLMHTQNWSAEKAMSALGFDTSEYQKYLALL